jgi:hypothetical protein
VQLYVKMPLHSHPYLFTLGVSSSAKVLASIRGLSNLSLSLCIDRPDSCAWYWPVLHSKSDKGTLQLTMCISSCRPYKSPRLIHRRKFPIIQPVLSVSDVNDDWEITCYHWLKIIYDLWFYPDGNKFKFVQYLRLAFSAGPKWVGARYKYTAWFPGPMWTWERNGKFVLLMEIETISSTS